MDYKINDKTYDYYIVDELGGIHTDGIGYAPDGTFCGECTKASCKDCPAVSEKYKGDV